MNDQFWLCRQVIKCVIYSYLALVLFANQSIAQVPHEWYLGKGKVMKFTMYGGMEIVDDTTVMESFGRSQHFQVLDENDSVYKILYEDLVWEKTPTGFVKTKLGDDNNYYKCWAVYDDLIVYEKLTQVEQEVYLKVFNSKEVILLDIFSRVNSIYIQSVSIKAINFNEFFVEIFYNTTVQFPLLKTYYIRKDSVYKTRTDTLLQKKILGRQISINGIHQFNLNNNDDLLSFHCYNDTLGGLQDVFYNYVKNYDDNGHIILILYDVIMESKATRLDGSFYYWGTPQNLESIIAKSNNDSFLYIKKVKTEWVQDTDRFNIIFRKIEMLKKSIISSVDRYDFITKDSTKPFPIFNNDIIQNFEYPAPNAKTYIPFILENNSSCFVSIKQNKEAQNLRSQIRIIEKPELDVFNNLKTSLPKFNKSHKRLEFRRGRECTQQLRLFAFADSYYDSFEWHIVNDTGGYDIHYGKTLAYDAPGRDKFYVIVKGIHTATGYFAWYSDTVDFTTAPKASFTADTSQWCQYVALQMQNTSHSEILKNESSLWRIYHNGLLEKTYKSNNPKITFDQTGNYDIELIYNNGYCKDSIRSSAAIEIIEAPKPGFALKDSVLCTPDSVIISDLAQGRITDRYYLWNRTDTIRTEIFTRIVTTPGFYQIEQILTGPTGCVTKAEHRVRAIPGFTENDKIAALTVNVLDSQRTELLWKPNVSGMGYAIYRDHQFLDTIPDPYRFSLVDTQLNTQEFSYLYYIQGLDSCGHATAKSNPVSTILLTSANENNALITLQWNKFYEWENGVEYYKMAYSLDNQTWQEFAAVNDSFTTDNPINYNEGQTIYYRVTAIESVGNQQISQSNIVKEKLQPTLFIPNAFTPNGDGLNDVFTISSFGIKGLKFTVISRTGQIVQFSTNPDALWDGFVNGIQAPAGPYVYTMEATTAHGTSITKTGILLLVD